MERESGQELRELSKKLNVLIALSLRQLVGDKDFNDEQRRKRGAGAYARYLASMGLNAKDIAEIIGAPLSSVRTLLTPSRKR
jgi:hypothetical protein